MGQWFDQLEKGISENLGALKQKSEKKKNKKDRRVGGGQGAASSARCLSGEGRVVRVRRKGETGNVGAITGNACGKKGERSGEKRGKGAAIAQENGRRERVLKNGGAFGVGGWA